MFRFSLEDIINRDTIRNESTNVNRLPNIFYQQQAEKQAYLRQQIAQQAANEASQNQVKVYNVQKGDNLWNIARANNISLDELKSLNPQLKSDVIHVGDKLKLAPEYETKLVNLKQEQAQEDIWNRNNLDAIQHAQHDGNYVIKGRQFKGANNSNIDAYDALLYKWNGRNNQLTNHLATPEDNNYIRNVKSYFNNFEYYEQRKYRK